VVELIRVLDTHSRPFSHVGMQLNANEPTMNRGRATPLLNVQPSIVGDTQRHAISHPQDHAGVLVQSSRSQVLARATSRVYEHLTYPEGGRETRDSKWFCKRSIGPCSPNVTLDAFFELTRS
jgi:hypothetical protein